VERGAGRKKIPIPHLSPPPSQREGGGLGEEPHLYPPLKKGGLPPQILPLPLGGGGEIPTSYFLLPTSYFIIHNS